MALTRTFSLLSLEGFWDDIEEDVSSEPLCVPDDPLHEIDGYPTSFDCYLLSQSLQLEPPKRAAISAAPSAGNPPEEPRKKTRTLPVIQNRPIVSPLVCQVPKKPRTKRTGKRCWSSDRMLPSPSSVDDLGDAADDDDNYGVRKRCSYCYIDNTPQWRSGPDGPRTLCNACGIKYKTGRLSLEVLVG